jgi:dihydroorotase
VETLLPVTLDLHHRAGVPLATLFERLSLAPARLTGLEAGHLGKGALADLVLFDPGAPWRIDRKALHSKSKNSPFHERLVQGRVLGTWVGGRRVFG